MDFWALGILMLGISSISASINFVVTILKLRAPGMSINRMPLFTWMTLITAFLLLFAIPSVTMASILILLDRHLGTHFYQAGFGGDPLLWQHLFWSFGHPEVYILILPAFGIISEVLPVFARKPIFGYTFVAFASIAIAVLGFVAWGHHMFVSSQSAYAGMVFSLTSFLVSVPSAIKVFNWTMTLHRGSISFQTPMLYALGFIGLFTVGGLTGLFVATLAVDVHLTDTYFVIAHFHYIMVGGAVMGYLGGLHYWWPKITGKLYPRFWSRISAMVIFIGFNVTFFPQFILGYLGMPRRYHAYPPEFQVLNVMSSAGATILGVGYLIPLIYFIWSMRYGRHASSNPWGVVGLEWETTSPPPTENFETPPVITRGPYEYSRPEEVADGR